MLAGRTVMVTGAGSGIGRACAQLFAREGAGVLVCDLDADAATQVAKDIANAGGNAQATALDVRDGDDVEAAVRAAVDLLGGLDCAVNNAGVSGPIANVDVSDPQAWSRTVETNLGGTYLCLRAELRMMVELGTVGAIVNMSSEGGLVGMPSLGAYVASKHGVIGLTKSAALEFAARGIRVNAVCPGPTLTSMVSRHAEEAGWSAEQLAAHAATTIPLGRHADPQEIAEAALWLCSDRSSFVTGHALVVDGGRTAR